MLAEQVLKGFRSINFGGELSYYGTECYGDEQWSARRSYLDFLNSRFRGCRFFNSVHVWHDPCRADVHVRGFFTPTVSGVRNATLLVEPTGVPPQAIALSGAGLAHAGSSVTLSPSSLTFSLAGVPQLPI